MDKKKTIEYFKNIGLKNLEGKVIGLVGDLGAGKTTFIKELIEEVEKGSSHQVSSPTFSLCNTYSVQDSEIHHYDLYRIENEDELIEIGIFDSIEGRNAIVFIEWVDLFAEIRSLCNEIVNIKIFGSEKSREFEIENIEEI